MGKGQLEANVSLPGHEYLAEPLSECAKAPAFPSHTPQSLKCAVFSIPE